jgi:hypothetical protein
VDVAQPAGVSAATPKAPYDATARRPGWSQLPDEVRDRIVAWTGRPTAVEPAGGGFTGGFAATVRVADGPDWFVKAVGTALPSVHDAYLREAQVHAVLPARVPAPRLREFAQVDVDDGAAGDRWAVLGFEHRPGRMPGLPWTDADLRRTIAALESTADALRELEWGEAERLADDAAGEAERAVWGELEPAWLATDLRGWFGVHRQRLTEATEAAAEAFRSDEWAHCDVRADNLVLSPDGSVWITDWNWLLHAPEWVDLGLLLPQVHADGVDLAPAYRSRLLADVPADQLDAGLAWLAALMFVSVPQEPFPGASPYLRAHQRWTGEATLRLLRERWS